MKKIFSILIVLFLFGFTLLGSACSDNDTNNYIDLSVYFENNVQIITEVGNTSSVDITKFTSNNDYELSRYNQVVLKSIPKWTYGLYIETIEFDLVANEKLTFDMEIFISNIVQSDTSKYNADLQWHFHHMFYFETDPEKPSKIIIEVNEQFNNLAGGISLVVDKYSTLLNSSTLKFSITNLKIQAYHAW